MSNETLREQSKREDEWREYKEPLARIFKEVRKARQHYIDKGYWKHMREELKIQRCMSDTEIKPEIENLLSKMIHEIKGEQ